MVTWHQLVTKGGKKPSKTFGSKELLLLLFIYL